MKIAQENWKVDNLWVLLQSAVDLEFWTIPYYMSVMYSIKDKSSEAYQLIRTIINQEMLHLQSAANIANAYGYSPSLGAPVYKGTSIPHLNFNLDNPQAIKPYEPYTAEIGPLDTLHVNAMCIVEIPDYDTHKTAKLLDKPEPIQLFSKPEEYGSIGAFYNALRYVARLMQHEIKGGVRQIDSFSAFYRNTPQMIVTASKDEGFNQVDLLIDLITDQGEGQSVNDEIIPHQYQNTADDIKPGHDHFHKFNLIKKYDSLPETFSVKPKSNYTNEDRQLEKIVVEKFTALRDALQGLFRGENPDNFYPLMATVGAAIRNCWESGITPKFS